MTAVDVSFRYKQAPAPATIRALDSVREVYGIRRMRFAEKDMVVEVEYDASRLNEDTVAALLRRSGLSLGEKLLPV